VCYLWPVRASVDGCIRPVAFKEQFGAYIDGKSSAERIDEKDRKCLVSMGLFKVKPHVSLLAVQLMYVMYVMFWHVPTEYFYTQPCMSFSLMCRLSCAMRRSSVERVFVAE